MVKLFGHRIPGCISSLRAYGISKLNSVVLGLHQWSEFLHLFAIYSVCMSRVLFPVFAHPGHMSGLLRVEVALRWCSLEAH
jgi:hypothetical protein